jgi:hypothetical protein
MARRIYSAIEKFKRVEVALRSATNGFRAALAEIDRALAGPRTAEELALSHVWYPGPLRITGFRGFPEDC